MDGGEVGQHERRVGLGEFWQFEEVGSEHVNSLSRFGWLGRYNSAQNRKIYCIESLSKVVIRC